MLQIIRTLVVDDSAFVRKVVKQMLSRSPFIEVVGTARDGEEALEMVEQLNPDVVTTDLIMPNMDGVEFLREQMKRRPVPVVVVSIANESGEMALEALDAGAIDFIQKPTALATEKVFEISDELIQKVKTAANVSVAHLLPIPAGKKISSPISISRSGSIDILVLGASTGGPQALTYLISQLPENFPIPVAIILHMPVGYTEMYANRLNELSRVKVVEAKEGDPVLPGVVLIAPAGRHLTFIRQTDGTVVTHLDSRPFDTLHRPSVDVLFQSAAEVFRDRVLGVVMTGMGSDGKQGAAWIRSQGGLVYTEAEETCVVYGMPRSVVEAGLSLKSIRLNQMIPAILEVL
ncbi:chemotaxis response regulator protein-glutamate methylesterase [Scytonema hofmannii PCC 7110]|uniref:Protein-glutamate methylesterase/protein-glutamine glutaminase n=1 Tax=Scytonema hofmannii PCC 7110 TaxID=128403 RepID=A0A139XEQ6_9CYAN|nr:chemotaxis-specific protein-glutamate methyltransferase CheB [Scytonema hofmannii]KYC43185.1 chemotaxis response regulator protein-glutamate methylesterase [Scytonema hofmannii PCC 7110]